eukprot:1372873-Amphidinium_carterae.1
MFAIISNGTVVASSHIDGLILTSQTFQYNPTTAFFNLVTDCQNNQQLLESASSHAEIWTSKDSAGYLRQPGHQAGHDL